MVGIDFGAEDWHPTVLSQQKFANEITPYLREFMGW